MCWQCICLVELLYTLSTCLRFALKSFLCASDCMQKLSKTSEISSRCTLQDPSIVQQEPTGSHRQASSERKREWKHQNGQYIWVCSGLKFVDGIGNRENTRKFLYPIGLFQSSLLIGTHMIWGSNVFFSLEWFGGKIYTKQSCCWCLGEHHLCMFVWVAR